MNNSDEDPDSNQYHLSKSCLKYSTPTGTVSSSSSTYFSRSHHRQKIVVSSQRHGRVVSPSHSAHSAASQTASARNEVNDSEVNPLSPPSNPKNSSPSLKSKAGSKSSGPNVVSSSSKVNHNYYKQINNKESSPAAGDGTGTHAHNRPTVNTFVSQQSRHQQPINQNQLAYRKETMSIPQNILTSKQNALAQVSLTPEENNDRQNSPNHTPVGTLMMDNDLLSTNFEEGPREEGAGKLDGLSGVSHLDDEDDMDEKANNDEVPHEFQMFKKDINKKLEMDDQTADAGGKVSESSNSLSMAMTLCDIEDEDFELENHESPGDDQASFALGDRRTTNLTSFPHAMYPPELDNSNFYQASTQQQQLPKHQQGQKSLRNHDYGFGDLKKPIVKTLDGRTWRDLKMIVVGPNGILHDGWLGQGFSFDHHIPYGLVQKRGGPCGVLAVVQALVLRNLMFGSPFCDDNDLPVVEPITNIANDPASARTFSFRRVKALICALTEIIWRCGTRDGQFQPESSPVWSESSDFKLTDAEALNENGEHGATVCFSGASAGAEIRIFHQAEQLKNFIHVNLQKFDCVSLVYSAVLSRGIENVQEDFDFPNSPLLGSHGYCSQELVNLLTIGKAISNVFDDQVTLDDKVLKGIEGLCDVGLLSLFEHYDSCRVGNYLKNPAYPLWIICSESHFSVLFSTNLALASDATIDKFDLFYYDGLGRQQNNIQLTIELVPDSESRRGLNRSNRKMRIQAGSSATSFNNNNNNDCDVDEEMVPPIEKCIRTKWKNAVVDWNDTEPIL